MTERLPFTAVRYLSTRMRDFSDGSLRGFCLVGLKEPGASDPYTEQDFLDLAATGANVVRVPINLNKTADGAGYEWPAAEVAYVKRVLDYGARLGFRVVLTVHPNPGGQASEWWTNPDLQQSLISTWVGLTTELEFCPALQAYDLVNEPTGATYDLAIKTRWLSIAQCIADAIRKIDTRTPIMVEPAWWGLPGSFWQSRPLRDIEGLVASFHWYDPHQVSHQGLPGYPASQAYPTAEEGKARGYERMLEARKFCANYGVPMFVGEFSCVRWAPGNSAANYVRDAVEMFAAERWGGTYHVWRGYDGWDAEIAQDKPQDTGKPSDRRPDAPVLAALKAWFARR